jgi:cytochrome P450
MKPMELLEALASSQGRDDPYPIYSLIREYGPLVALPGGDYLCTGYDEIGAVLRSPEFGVRSVAMRTQAQVDSLAYIGAVDYFAYSILHSNPPDHRRMRSLMNSAFTPRRAAGLEPAVARLCDRLLDELVQRSGPGRPVDFMEYFAFRLPVKPPPGSP